MATQVIFFGAKELVMPVMVRSKSSFFILLMWYFESQTLGNVVCVLVSIAVCIISDVEVSPFIRTVMFLIYMLHIQIYFRSQDST